MRYISKRYSPSRPYRVVRSVNNEMKAKCINPFDTGVFQMWPKVETAIIIIIIAVMMLVFLSHEEIFASIHPQGCRRAPRCASNFFIFSQRATMRLNESMHLFNLWPPHKMSLHRLGIQHENKQTNNPPLKKKKKLL